MKPALFGRFTHLQSSSRAGAIDAERQAFGQPVCEFADLTIYGESPTTRCAISADKNIVVAIVGRPAYAQSARDQVAEALLASYQQRGIDAVQDLRNEFAVAIFDRAQRRAFLCIDRIGRMPLAYAQSGDHLYFSTDSRAVATAIDATPQLNRQALYDYTFFHAVPSSETVFKNVAKLPPAGLLQWHADKQNVKLFWQPTFAQATRASSKDLGKEFLTCLENGVKASEPDQHSASFLSGGIDSSTVTGLLARILGRGRPAYTIGFEQAGYDETEYARTAANHFGAELRVHYISTKEVQECVPELAAIYDEPFGNSSAVPALVCSRLAKADGINRMLAGDGGDELFAGNTRYAKQRVFEAYNYLPQAGKALAEKFFLSSTIAKTPLRKVGSYISQARIPLPDRLESYNFLLRENVGAIFEKDFLAQIDTQHPFELMRAQYSQLSDTATLDRMLYLDWKFTLADNDLRKVNATCRHAGVQVNFPWLDDGVIDFSTRLPPSLKMRGSQLRYFAKQALTGFLPTETLTKSKHGFGLPFGQWLKTSPELQTQIYDLLSALGRRGIVQPQFIQHLIDQHRGGHAAYYGTMVWVLAMLEAWLQANKNVRI